ncbi:hypothetical protein EC988_001059 [Linderina pennispora]|nr:hypothetical protein EC988_001059 [Linderina pennispora]
MSDIVEGVVLVFNPAQDSSEDTDIIEFPFELIESYTPVQDIPQYMFRLERQVVRETQEYRDEEAVRKMHIEMQRTKPEEEQEQAPAVNRQPEESSVSRAAQPPESPVAQEQRVQPQIVPPEIVPPQHVPPMSPLPEQVSTRLRPETMAATSRVKSLASSVRSMRSSASLVAEEQGQKGKTPVKSKIKSIFWSRSKTSQL